MTADTYLEVVLFHSRKLLVVGLMVLILFLDILNRCVVFVTLFLIRLLELHETVRAADDDDTSSLGTFVNLIFL